MKNLKTILAIFTLTVMITSCEKGEKGDPGPAGPIGPTGATGAQGPGATHFDKTILNWDPVPNILTLTAADGIKISSTDAVLGFLQAGSDWIGFPYIRPVGGAAVDQIYRTYYHTDNFRLYVVNLDGTATLQTDIFTPPQTIRIVVIPARLANPDVNVNNYEEVKAAYNLKD